MRPEKAKRILMGICALGLLALPVVAQAQSVTFTSTARHVKFL
jgi:hypothetical protein